MACRFMLWSKIYIRYVLVYLTVDILLNMIVIFAIGFCTRIGCVEATGMYVGGVVF